MILNNKAPWTYILEGKLKEKRKRKNKEKEITSIYFFFLFRLIAAHLKYEVL